MMSFNKLFEEMLAFQGDPSVSVEYYSDLAHIVVTMGVMTLTIIVHYTGKGNTINEQIDMVIRNKRNLRINSVVTCLLNMEELSAPCYNFVTQIINNIRLVIDSAKGNQKDKQEVVRFIDVPCQEMEEVPPMSVENMMAVFLSYIEMGHFSCVSNGTDYHFTASDIELIVTDTNIKIDPTLSLTRDDFAKSFPSVWGILINFVQ